MKKFVLSLYFICLVLAGQSQQGLEKVIVEKYYVSDANDYAKSGNTLPVGSVTWRIYVDMASGWNLQIVGGDVNHSLKFTTTTSFYNDDNGSSDPTSVTTTTVKKGTTLLDSYVTNGAASKSYWGVLKSEQTTANPIVGVNGNTDGALKNADTGAGIALTSKDGMLSAGTVPSVGYLGIDQAELDKLGDGTVTGNSFTITNGSWFKLGGVVGPTTNNRVLIAQITTDGTFHYELNLQLGKDLGGGLSTTERYAVYPAADEFGGSQYNLSGTLNPASASPTVSITAPTGGTTYDEGAIVSLTANAADADGTIAKVEYYINNSKVGEASTAPYSLNWTSVAGSLALTAIAYDYEGNHTTSVPVNITVNAQTPPTVSITAPLDGSRVYTGDSLSISANAADADGTVTKVEFFANGVKKGEVASAPYKISYKTDVTDKGTDIITAKATDNKGAVTTSAPVSITVADNVNPTVSITSPQINAQFKTDTTIVITASASDPDGTVSKVEFFIDNGSIGSVISAPYQKSWPVTAGNHNILAKVTDNKGAISNSLEVPITISNNKLPAVNITAPADAASFKVGDLITVTAIATDDDGSVSKVEFFVDGVSIGTDNTSPYSSSYTGVLGTHSITAKATDNGGAIKTSNAVAISVANSAPVISITSPSNNTTLGKTVTIVADASDADGTVTSVEFFVDGVSAGIDASMPYSVVYNAVNGTHTLTAKAIDNSGNQTTSLPINVTVSSVGIGTATSSEPAFIVYPNPAKDIVTLEFAIDKPGKFNSYKIINLEGEVLFNKKIISALGKYVEHINISSFAKGQYIIQVLTDSCIISLRFIKQ